MSPDKKKHILLLIDDKPANLFSLKMILENENREIITCNSASEGLQVLLKEKVSLILVDVQMPEMDGYEFVEIIKQHPDTSNIPTIFVTAISDEPKYINKAYDLGAIDFLFKPLITEVTRKKVDSFLKIWDYDQQLKKVNNQLLEKNKELENFANIIAHDLKTPLANIKCLIDYIEEEKILKVNEPASELFEMVKTSATSMSKLIDDLLYYSKNVQNNEGKKSVHLQTEVESVIKLIRIDNDIIINKVNLDHIISFQPVAFKQIIQNLVSNAIKYNDKEVTKITIIYSEEEKTIAIQDNGPGIPEDQQEKVFDMFYTLGKTSKGDSSTGIGLNLVKKLAERNNCSVYFNNDDSEGTTIVISNLIPA
ncbi:signal transduction histidine kinase [Flavobacterium sp. CG_9.10]|uniref:sensor histidine kinase n=1 Tax=Flavobacterium sp. CG_9.10 TaxID=2787729 RepID=UPI0018C96153|nr:hybrid sensor histidine kinase/response regulator [Flavobacterium sp. CG_9.10]MBG6109757.1 signal transduction histidine kinase [Flavobacterium sp. CG_9.10]